MKWRCLNNIFGYCSGEPEFAEKPKVAPGVAGTVYAGTCKLDLKTCTKFIARIEPVEIHGAGYKHTITTKTTNPCKKQKTHDHICECKEEEKLF